MNLHEYQAKKILRTFGIDVLPGFVAYTAQEVQDKISALTGKSWVVKAQVQAGGRGKAGGIKLVKSIDELISTSQKLLGSRLVTAQTDAEGKLVRKVYIEETCEIDKEFYLSLTIDRSTQQYCLLVSPHGGVDIEEVAQKNPDALLKLHIDPLSGLWPYQCRKIAYFLGLEGNLNKSLGVILARLYEAFVNCDAQMIEINPLVVTKDERLLPLDAKLSLDDNALFRHANLKDLCDWEELTPAEIESDKLDLSYIKLNGNIGCMVNGAGLAMATLDLITHYGAKPANFLDVGGGASREKIAAAFRLILSDPEVEGILINIFGGIMRCDVLAEGIVQAIKDIRLSVPVVVRLEGTNSEEGRRILHQAHLDIYPAQTLDEAAQLIVNHVKG